MANETLELILNGFQKPSEYQRAQRLYNSLIHGDCPDCNRGRLVLDRSTTGNGVDDFLACDRCGSKFIVNDNTGMALRR